jgi:hypothetical protein
MNCFHIQPAGFYEGRGKFEGKKRRMKKGSSLLVAAAGNLIHRVRVLMCSNSLDLQVHCINYELRLKEVADGRCH